MTITDLHNLIEFICPILGCSSDGAIWFKNEASEEQKVSAQQIMEENINNINDV